MIERLLFDIEEKLKNEGLDKKKVNNYSDIYSLDIEDLQKLVEMEWTNENVLSSMIKTFGIEDKQLKNDKLKLLKWVNSNLDKEETLKINSCLKVINHLEEFKNDYSCAEGMVIKFAHSKTDEGVKLACATSLSLLENLNEEDYSEELMNIARTRISEIIGFITRTEEEFKINDMKNLIEVGPTDKLGVLCALIITIVSSKNEKQTSAIVDIVKNKDIYNNDLTLMAASFASHSSDEDLNKIYQLLGYTKNLENLELNNELEEIISDSIEQSIKPVQRKY